MKVFGIEISRGKQSAKHPRYAEIAYYTPRREVHDFAKQEIIDCQKMITSRLENAYFQAKVDFVATRNIFCWLKESKLELVNRLFFDGYVIVDCDSLAFVDVSQRTRSKTLHAIDIPINCNETVLASETYRARGHSDFHFLKQKLNYLNVLNSSDMQLIENYGAMGIISPEPDGSVAGNEYTEEDINTLQDRYKKQYGITFGKWSIMFTPRPARYQPISLPVAGLQLNEKRLYALKAIFAAFEIPKELSVYFESAKYANRNEAELDMYANTVAKWANIQLRLATLIYDNRRLRDSYLLPNEFWYDFVGVTALAEAKKNEATRLREMFDFWNVIALQKPEFKELAETRIKDILENL